MLIDSGAELNIIGSEDWEAICHQSRDNKIVISNWISNPTETVHAYATQRPLKLNCSFTAWIRTVEANKPEVLAKFVVVEGGLKSILGRDTAITMKLLMVGLEVNLLLADPEPRTFPSIPGIVINFDINKDVAPVRHTFVNIPIHFQKAATEELRKMERLGIIERAPANAKWVSGISAVPKGKDGFRLVINMKGPNKAINRQIHKMPRIEQIKSRLANSKIFTKLDLTSAYHHLMLGEESRELTTFMGPDGLYRFTRLVFGVNCAPEIFQREMERVLSGIDDIEIYIDDVLIRARNEEELEATTRRVIEALEANNLTLNKSKCEFRRKTITFLGHQISEKGINIDEKKVETIRKFRRPTTPSELKSFLGITSFLGPHFKDLAHMTHPLRKCAKGKTLEWGEEQEKAFNDVKEAIIKNTVTLGFFKPEDKTALFTDASPYALGAVLVQEDAEGTQRIISFASKSLTPTEQRYPQTQREALAIVWGAEYYYYYLLGKEFTIKTDASGVAIIFNRDDNGSKQLLRRAEGWATRLEIFDFKVVHISGTQNIADPSSRLYEGQDEAFDEERIGYEIAMITAASALPEGMVFDDDYLSPTQVAWETKKDEELSQVIVAIETDVWSDIAKPYKSLEQELSLQGGVITRAGIVIIPQTLRQKALQLAHKGHPGSTKMKSIIRSRVWWPRIGLDVENWVESCRVCTLNAKAEPHAPMERSRMPDEKWANLAMDHCGPYAMYGGISVLGVIDKYSRYMTAAVVPTTDSDSTITALRTIFERWGVPKTIQSDNATCFKSVEMAQFCTDRGIELTHSAPLAPWQNGMAERSMQTISKAMKSASVEDGDYERALAEAMRAHNSSAHRVTGEVPQEVMLGRRVRWNLPLMRPTTVDINTEEMDRRDWEEKTKAGVRENKKRRARDPQINPGDTVVLKRAARRKGQTNYDPTELEVIERRNGDLTMRDPEGSIVRRDITFAKKMKSNAQQEPERDEERDTRPTRDRRAPAYLGDYVNNVEKDM